MNRIRRIGFVSTFVVAAFIACATMPMKAAAQMAEEKAYALQRSYIVVLNDALLVARNPQTQPNAVEAIKAAIAKAGPVVDEMDKAAVDVSLERAKFNAGQSTAKKLKAVETSLQDWIAKAEQQLLAVRASARP
jgi:hypothetical protein